MPHRALFLSSLILALSTACSFINLSPFTYATYPSQPNQILPGDARIKISFNDNLNQQAAQEAVNIKSKTGIKECDYSWEENDLIIIPRSPWVKGNRWTLQIKGTFFLDDGRTFNENKVIPFFIENLDPPPALWWFSPGDEEVVSLKEPLIFKFSQPMNTEKGERFFSLSPDTPRSYLWNEEKDQMTVTPQTAWEGKIRYSVVLNQELVNQQEVPLNQEYSFQFRTLQDTQGPQIARALPWDKALGFPFPQGDLENLDNQLGVYLEFNEEIQTDSWKSSWSISPRMDFHFFLVNAAGMALVPKDIWIPGQTYVLTLSTKISDISGNPLEEEIKLSLRCSLPPQGVTRIVHSPPDPDTSFPLGSSPPPQPITADNRGDHGFTLNLALPILREDLPSFLDSLSMESIIPSTLPTPSLKSASLISNTELFLVYSNFDVPARGSNIDHFYRLKQKADKRNTLTSDGSYLLEDWEVIYVIEAEI